MKGKSAVPIKLMGSKSAVMQKKTVVSKAKKDEDEAYTTKLGKAQKEKDPNAPKRPMSSYFLFMNERRPILQKEKPELKFGELTKSLTDDWKSLSDKEKKKYEDMAAKAKEIY